VQWVQTVSAPARQYVPAGVPPAAAQWVGLTATLAGAALALWLLFKVEAAASLCCTLVCQMAPCCKAAATKADWYMNSVHDDNLKVVIMNTSELGCLCACPMLPSQKLLPAIFGASRQAQGGRYVRDRGLGGREVFVPDVPQRVCCTAKHRSTSNRDRETVGFQSHRSLPQWGQSRIGPPNLCIQHHSCD
jgi:hypothetical protein